MQKDRKKRARVIAVFAGAGAGKSTLLRLLQERCRCLILAADRIAHGLYEPGEAVYGTVMTLLGKGILDESGRIDRKKMADRLYRDDALLERVNALVHPPVWEAVKSRVKESLFSYDLIFVEAALLPLNPLEICDEIWYIHSGEEIRRRRLAETRGYTRERTDAIFGHQP